MSSKSIALQNVMRNFGNPFTIHRSIVVTTLAVVMGGGGVAIMGSGGTAIMGVVGQLE